MASKTTTQAALPLGDIETYAPTSDCWKRAIETSDKLVVYCAAAAIIATIRSMASATRPGEISASAIAARFGLDHEQLSWLVEQSTTMRLKTRLQWADPKSRTTLAIAMPEDVTQRIFAHWITATGRSHAKLDAKRKARIDARLAEGISPAMMIRAIDGIANSDWHRGRNDRNTRFDTIEVVFRDAASVERFAEMKAGTPTRDLFDRAVDEASER